MVKKSSKKKLTIARDTIRALQDSSLEAANGGNSDFCMKGTIVGCCLNTGTVPQTAKCP
jgi:hypothetical protein